MKKRSKKGVTLVELIISVFIFSSVMVSIFSLYSFSVVESYKQSRGMNVHVDGVGTVEKQEMGVMQNVDQSKDIKLFNGFGTSSLPGSEISVEVTANTFGTNNKTIVSINSSDQDIFEYLEKEHGRVGPKFASLLLPQEVDVANEAFPEEYRNKIASFFEEERANYKHSKMDFSKYQLPNGNYELRYLLYDVSGYKALLGSFVDGTEIYKPYPDSSNKAPLTENKSIMLNKNGKDIFSSSNIADNKVEKNPNLKFLVNKKEPTGAWTFFDKQEESLLTPGKYILVFELKLQSLAEGVKPAEALKIFRRLRHFGNVNSMDEIIGGKRLIARDIIFVENLTPNIFVNAGKELYIGSIFDKFNLTKQDLGKSDGVIEFIGELPNATLYFNKNGNGERLAKRGLIYNRDDKKQASIYALSNALVSTTSAIKNFNQDFFKFDWYHHSLASLVTYASSTSPYGNRTKGMTAFIDREGQLLHTDQRFKFASGASSVAKAYNTGKSGQYFVTKNNRLFNANTYNIALLKGLWEGGKGKKKYHDRDGELLLFGSYRWANNNRNVQIANTGYKFSDLYVDFGNEGNQPTREFLGLTGNLLIEIGTRYKEDDTVDSVPVKYIYTRYKDFPHSEEMESEFYSDAVTNPNYLKAVQFLKFHPLNENQYLILAKKDEEYKLLSLFRDLRAMDVKSEIVKNKKIVLDISHNKRVKKAELDEERDIFKAEIVQKMTESIKGEIRDTVNAYKQGLKADAKGKLRVEDEIRLGVVVERFVDLKLNEAIEEQISDIVKNIQVKETNKWNGVELSANIKETINSFSFKIDDAFGYNEYVVSETLYPSSRDSSDVDVKFIYDTIKQDKEHGFMLYGNDLYVHVQNQLYRFVPKGASGGEGTSGTQHTIVFNKPIKILETGTPVKNIYIHDKSKFIEIK